MIQAVFRDESLDLVPAGVYVVDKAGVIQHYNRRAGELWGRNPLCADKRERFCGSVRLYTPEGTVLPHHQSPIADVLADGVARSDLEVVMERPDGSRINVSLNIGPLRDGQGQIIGAVNCFQDITERSRFESELTRAKEAAEAANRAKDHFLAALSHELRTPLAPVLMTAAALETDQSLPQRVRDDVNLIRRNIELEARLIDDLLDLTRVARGKLELHCEAVDAHELIRDATQTCCGSDINNKRLNLSLQLHARRHFVWADSARLAQVFWNLIRNAVKFTPTGGKITVTSTNPSDERLVVQVTDTGIGIEPEALPKIFDAFEQGSRTVTRRFGGLGLGLAICKVLIEMHGGTIAVHSDGPDKGASFTVELDTIRAPASHVPKPAVPIGHHKGLRILLVEDHEMTARVMSRLLQGMEYDVKTANDVQSALDVAGQEKFDLLISDLGLPDGSGLDLMKQLREMYHLKGIAVSGYGMEEDVRRSRDVGFSAHLTKPVSIEKLQAAINHVA